jgi:hypothetical protein
MKNIKILAFLSVLFLTIQSNAQDSISIPIRIDVTTIGIGGGLDYGGFGGNILICPTKNVGFFAGAGYAFAGFGINAGVKFRFVPNKPTTRYSPFALIMYGYNAAIAVTNATQYSKIFYGPSIGVGFDYRSNLQAKGYWSVALLLPIRSSEVDDYIDDLKTNHNVEFKNGLIPIGISFGYRFIIN